MIFEGTLTVHFKYDVTGSQYDDYETYDPEEIIEIDQDNFSDDFMSVLDLNHEMSCEIKCVNKDREAKL